MFVREETMPKFATMLAASAAIALAATLTITAASAQTTNGAGIRNPGEPIRSGEMCWTNTDPAREVDVHGYWKACEPAPTVHRAVHQKAHH